MEKKTEHTHVSADTLLDELAQVRRQGYSLDREEFLEGMVALAVPVSGPNGQFVSALAFHGPTQRLDVEELVSQVGVMQEAARRISEALFTD